MLIKKIILFFMCLNFSAFILCDTEKSVTIICAMAGDNDLIPFAGRNLKQMQAIGSNERIKLIVNLDMHRRGEQKITKRFFIQKNQILQIGPDLCCDSGDQQNLINLCQLAIENYPSDEYILILWNHGTGILEPLVKRIVNPSELFNYNHSTRMIELNRSISFIDHLNNKNKEKKRGICFDDTTNNYLTNLKLKEALATICTKFLHGKKFAMIACDACLMQMAEVVSPLKNYTRYFVASQEVELGTGYNYTAVLAPFSSGYLSALDFSKHIVSCYSETYGRIMQDYTQSALDLNHIDQFEKSFADITASLTMGLQKQKDKSVKELIRLSINKKNCTYFDEQSYKDLGHFYKNILKNIDMCNLQDQSETENFKHLVKQQLNNVLNSINNLVIANQVGKNLKNAMGLSIYFPETILKFHSSYKQSEFAISTGWLQFLIQYLRN